MNTGRACFTRDGFACCLTLWQCFAVIYLSLTNACGLYGAQDLEKLKKFARTRTEDGNKRRR